MLLLLSSSLKFRPIFFQIDYIGGLGITMNVEYLAESIVSKLESNGERITDREGAKHIIKDILLPEAEEAQELEDRLWEQEYDDNEY